ncbi:Hypothetical protein SRAE_X000037500 [Strongyloides ratti]|uniref:Uncharacterized protein n=1 Tax=Strongyloides ratti TaxID=34506 RepID=A0A090N0P5_STRRB|nr:Hypothetical protein SRAE_X000037500 [Strongyloides ratti]CEF71048.1 Hypothetical protein SRAE_X000037500 [Strongyloides ratti]
MESNDLEKKSDIGKEVPKKDGENNKNIVKEKGDMSKIEKDMKQDGENITANVTYSQENISNDTSRKNYNPSKSVSSYFSEDENCGEKIENCKEKVRRYAHCKLHDDELNGKAMTKKEIQDKLNRKELKSAFHAIVDEARKKFLEEPETSTTPLMASASNEKEKTKSDVILSKSSPDIKLTDGKKENNTDAVSSKVTSDGKGESKNDMVLLKSPIHDSNIDVASSKVTSDGKGELKNDTVLSKLPIHGSTTDAVSPKVTCDGKVESKNDTILPKSPIHGSTSDVVSSKITSNGKGEFKNDTVLSKSSVNDIISNGKGELKNDTVLSKSPIHGSTSDAVSSKVTSDGKGKTDVASSTPTTHVNSFDKKMDMDEKISQMTSEMENLNERHDEEGFSIPHQSDNLSSDSTSQEGEEN